jgi:hypothetical protein
MARHWKKIVAIVVLAYMVAGAVHNILDALLHN